MCPPMWPRPTKPMVSLVFIRGHLLRSHVMTGTQYGSLRLARFRRVPTVEWFEGPRDELAELFALADDSEEAVRGYRDHGRVLVARDGHAIVGQLLLIDGEVKSLAVREERQGEGVG